MHSAHYGPRLRNSRSQSLLPIAYNRRIERQLAYAETPLGRTLGTVAATGPRSERLAGVAPYCEHCIAMHMSSHCNSIYNNRYTCQARALPATAELAREWEGRDGVGGGPRLSPSRPGDGLPSPDEPLPSSAVRDTGWDGSARDDRIVASSYGDARCPPRGVQLYDT